MRKSLPQHTRCITLLTCQRLSRRQAKKYAGEEAWNVPPWWPADGVPWWARGSRHEPSTGRKWRQAYRRAQATVKWRCKTQLIFRDMFVWECHLWGAGHVTFKPIFKGKTTWPRIWDFFFFWAVNGKHPLMLTLNLWILWCGEAMYPTSSTILSSPLTSFIDKIGLRNWFQN